MELTEDTMNSTLLNGMKSTSVVADAAMQISAAWSD